MANVYLYSKDTFIRPVSPGDVSIFIHDINGVYRHEISPTLVTTSYASGKYIYIKMSGTNTLIKLLFSTSSEAIEALTIFQAVVKNMKDSLATETESDLDDLISQKVQVEVELQLASYSGTIGQGATGATGPIGPAGERGAQGDRGEKGEKGDTGERGIQGIQGVAGSSGTSGVDGQIGVQGIRGEKGEKGDTGERGIQGIQGVAGSSGTSGVDGSVGAQGIRGEKGEKGDTGERGIQGAQGIKGDKGDQGEPGVGGVSYYMETFTHSNLWILCPPDTSFHQTVQVMDENFLEIEGLIKYVGNPSEDHLDEIRVYFNQPVSGRVILIGK